MDDDYPCIILDIGSAHVKAGLADEEGPKHHIPMICGTPKSQDNNMKEMVYGAEAISRENSLNLSYPVKDGAI